MNTPSKRSGLSMKPPPTPEDMAAASLLHINLSPSPFGAQRDAMAESMFGESNDALRESLGGAEKTRTSMIDGTIGVKISINPIKKRPPKERVH